jgi:hypothetical protein
VKNYELERIWKKTVVAYVKALFLHSPVGTEENHKKISVRIAGLVAEI